MDGNYVRSIGTVPVKDDRFPAQHSHAFQAKPVFRDKTQEIYLANRHCSIIEKYSPDGELISTFYGPELFFPEYNIVPAGDSYTMAPNKKTRFGYLDICYSKKIDRIFLLYSGRYFFSKEGTLNPSGGNIIYVLDNNDKVIEKIRLDRDIYLIKVSDDGSTIFGGNETEILKIEYKKIDR
jgi:hypothetical protein